LKNILHGYFLGDYVGGALRWEDLILYATEAGFTQPRLVTAKPITIDNEDIQKAIGTGTFIRK
jgi:arsenite methyltransferase